ncbi:hypothetical protein FAN06_26090 [Klebsiella pneumoniae subsp. pneumoniae]|nr:hypothetical protein FAN06_26090 [Klebsiella pneumoniae subsp. pneumoniae]
MLKKTALSCAASPFTTVPQRDCHLQPSSHNPHNPNSTCQPLPFPLAPPKPPQKYIKIFLTPQHPLCI